MRIVETPKAEGLAVIVEMSRTEWAEVVACMESDGQFRTDDSEVESTVCRVVLGIVGR